MSVRTRLILSAAQFAVAFATIPALGQTAQPPTAPPGAQPGAQPGAPPGAPSPAAGPSGFQGRFYAANTSHDGRLTLSQAQAAHMPAVVRNFSAIDTQNKGFVTIDDIRAFHRQQRASHASATPAPAGAPQ